MARPFLGSAYGDTDRSTSPRLLGGMPEASSQAPIGGAQLNAPGINVVQQLVDTFVNPSRGATMGGPLQIAAPPRVPQAQPLIRSDLPRPVNTPAPILGQIERVAPQYLPYQSNFREMSAALAGFSDFFKALQNTADNRERIADENAKAKGGALAQEASQAGVFSSLQDLQKHLEKGVAEGNVGYAEMLQRFQAADPRALRYASIAMQDAYIKSNAATLKERVSQTKKLLDGRPLESVPASDREYQRMVSALMFPEGTADISPEAFSANQQLLGATYGSIASDQEKRYGAYKTQKAKDGLTAVRDGNAMALVNGSIPLEQVAANLTDGLHGFYNGSGQTSEEYQKEKEGFAAGFVKSVMAAASGDWSKAKLALARVPEVLAQVQAGPKDANGKAPLLLDQIGGMEGLYKITKDLQEEVVSQQNLMDSLEAREAQEQVQVDIKDALTPEVLADPARIDATEEALLARGRQIYASNPEMALAYEEGIKKQFGGVRAGNVQPIQEQNELALWAQMADPANAKNITINQVVQLVQSNQISKAAGNQALSWLREAGEKTAAYNKQTVRDQINDITKRMEADFARGGSDGGALLTDKEARALREVRAQLLRRGTEIIDSNPGRDVTDQLESVYQRALEKAVPQSRTQAPASATPESISKGLAPGGRGNPQQNAQLRRQAESQPLYAKDRMVQQLDGILTNKPLDDATRQIIRRSGMKPSDFFSRQMQLHGIPLDGETRKRLQELDGGDLVSQAGGGTGGLGMMPTNAYLPVAQKLGLQFANAVMNAFVPPAQARGTSPFTGSAMTSIGTGFNGLLGMIRSGEGGWTSVNRGTAGDSGPIGNLTRMTIGAIEKMQERGSVFAVGAYQFTPGVLSRARRESGLSPSAPFTPENQNRLAMALITGSKRPALADYISGKSNNLNAAHTDIALEWAALQGPNGRGMYDGDSAGNMASIPAARVRAALQEARRAYLSGRR